MASASPEKVPAEEGAAVPPGPAAYARSEGALLLAAFAGLVVLNYLPTLRWMIARWEEEGSYMSHGWLIPPLSAWVLWMERKRIAAVEPRGSALGWLLVAPALLLHLAAGIADVSSVSGLTLVPLILGFVALRLGWEAVRAVWFPVCFLAFMVPPPEFVISGINFRLKFMASDMAAWLLNMTGLPAVRTGSFMLFGEEKLAIGDVCSGLRSLLALLAVGVFYAWLNRARGKSHVLAILAATVPAAIIGNGLRIGLVSYLVFFAGQEAVFKPLIGSWDVHLFTGAVIFLGAVGILAGVVALTDKAATLGRKGKGGAK